MSAAVILFVIATSNLAMSQVTASFNVGSGRLTINGGNANDVVNIAGTGVVGRVAVNATAFIGVNSIRVDLGGGADVLNVDSVQIGGEFSAKMGGNPGDFFEFLQTSQQSPIGGPLKLSGVADVELDGNGGTSASEPTDINVSGDISISLSGFGDVNGDGREVDIDDTNAGGKTTINGSNSVDRIRIRDSSFVRAVTINFKGGDDVLDIDGGAGDANNFDNLLEVKGGNGIDTVFEDFNFFSLAPIFDVETILP
jgi:hypothetical protein